MPKDVISQATAFLFSAGAGALYALIFDVFRISNRTFKTNKIIVALQDILYWIVITAITLVLIYNVNSGELRNYIFLGLISGAAAYLLIFSRVILFVVIPILSVIKKALLFIFTIILKVLKFVFGPFIKLGKLIKNIFIKQYRKIVSHLSKKVLTTHEE